MFLTVAQFQFCAGLMGGQSGRIAVPARLRYTGGFYETAGRNLSRALACGAHAIIFSGGYAPYLPMSRSATRTPRFAFHGGPRLSSPAASLRTPKKTQQLTFSWRSSPNRPTTPRHCEVCTLGRARHGIDSMHTVFTEIDENASIERELTTPPTGVIAFAR